MHAEVCDPLPWYMEADFFMVYSYYVCATMIILTWNVKVDLPWTFPWWSSRKHLFRKVIEQIFPDIFCVQEALIHQLSFFSDLLQNHKYIGVGREDGKTRGEYCACFYDARKFSLLSEGTFWLSETPDVPSRGFDLYPRICTWGKFRKIASKKDFYVYNTHLPLSWNKPAKMKAVHVLLKHIQKFSKNPVLLTGDFNAEREEPVRKSICSLGFQEAGVIAHTQHLFGIPLKSVDVVYANAYWSTKSYKTIREHSGFLYPSNHFGVVANVAMKE